MATSRPQLENAFAPFCAPVVLTMLSKSVRGISLSIWLNMLHDAFTLGLLFRSGRVGLPIHHYPTLLDGPTPFLSWTTVVERIGIPMPLLE